MTEKDIVNAILKHLKSVPMCFAFKEHGGMYGTAGLPDIICCIAGRFVAFEVKTSTGRLTKLQEITLQRINAAKGNAYKVTSVDELKNILASLEVFSYDDTVDVSGQTDSVRERDKGSAVHAAYYGELSG